MTKRINSKHKVDRRLKVNLWGRPKSPFNKRAYDQVSMVKLNKVNLQTTVFNYKQNKSLKLIMETLMKDSLEIFIKRLLCLKEIPVKI